jgi:DNA-binding transcriptional MerR regulator
MRIGELSRLTGVTAPALRFYERAGLLGVVTRDASGYRVYNDRVYRTLVTIRWAQDLGLRLEDIASILSAQHAPEPRARIAGLQRAIDARLSALREEIGRIERTIGSLERLRAVPFDGTCVMPASFVEKLVREHEEGHPRVRPRTPASRKTPKRRAR